ncbi:MAG: hypothetical protein WDO18_13285 [Acidobacteriota bacterium]
MGKESDFDAAGLAAFESPRRDGAGRAAESSAAQAEHTVFELRPSRNVDAPVRGVHAHAAMVVPSPRTGDQDEARAGVAELFLKHAANVGGDQIGRGGRITIMQNTHQPAFEEAVIEVIEFAMRID